MTIIMLKALVENVDNMHEQMGDFSREMKIKRKMEMLQIHIMVRDKECFQSALQKLLQHCWAQEKMSALKDGSIEITQSETLKQKKENTEQRT